MTVGTQGILAQVWTGLINRATKLFSTLDAILIKDRSGWGCQTEQLQTHQTNDCSGWNKKVVQIVKEYIQPAESLTSNPWDWLVVCYVPCDLDGNGRGGHIQCTGAGCRRNSGQTHGTLRRWSSFLKERRVTNTDALMMMAYLLLAIYSYCYQRHLLVNIS